MPRNRICFSRPNAMDAIRGIFRLLLQLRRASPAPVHCCCSNHGVTKSGWLQEERLPRIAEQSPALVAVFER